MNRTEIECTLNEGRAKLLKFYADYTAEQLLQPITVSEVDPDFWWTVQDHLVHLTGVEKSFRQIIERQIAGESAPIPIFKNEDGTPRGREEILQAIHQMNDAWVKKHRGRSFDEIVALGQQTRSQTLALLASLNDDQLAMQVPGAPWGGGIVGGIINANAGHEQMHHQWIQDGLAAVQNNTSA